MHTYIHTYIHTHIHTHMHACIHTYVRTYIHTYIIHICIYVTGFEKTRLPHTSDFMNSVTHNLLWLNILFLYATTPLCKIFRSIAHSQTKLHCIKVRKLDVCESLVFSNPVTYVHMFMHTYLQYCNFLSSRSHLYTVT